MSSDRQIDEAAIDLGLTAEQFTKASRTIDALDHYEAFEDDGSDLPACQSDDQPPYLR